MVDMVFEYCLLPTVHTSFVRNFRLHHRVPFKLKLGCPKGQTQGQA